MDIFYNSLTNFPESTNDYISNVIHTKLPNTYGFLAVIVVFFFIFSYFTKSNSMASPSFESNSNSMSLELILIVDSSCICWNLFKCGLSRPRWALAQWGAGPE